MLYGIMTVLAFMAGIVAGFFLTASWVRNQMTYKAHSSKPQVKENMYPYDWKADEEFLAIIDNYKRGK
jgi:uncharacterized protein YneF (UPF0154 family)